jgi:hypothetical protein
LVVEIGLAKKKSGKKFGEELKKFVVKQFCQKQIFFFKIQAVISPLRKIKLKNKTIF